MKTPLKHFIGFPLGALLALIAGAATLSAENRPNVILVITDDQGYGDLASQGNPHINTPHLDRLHDESVRFTNFHVSTTCAPTRGALMTGRHSNRVNVYHTITGRSMIYGDERLLPQVLAENGYRTGMFGKWHLGDNYPFRPEDRGFQEVVRHGGGGIAQGPDYWGNDYFDDTYWHNGEPQAYEGYCTDVFFDEALSFIENNQDEPFFAYISTNAPHAPLNLPEKYFDLYRGNPDLTELEQRFFGMISNIDDNMQRLEQRLEALDLRDNTILIFMTDNGGTWGRNVFNAGLRAGKGSVYDGGHRVPFFVRWPDGGLLGGRDDNRLVAHVDLLPTFVDLLGLDFIAGKPLDGISFADLLRDPATDWPNRIMMVDTQRLQNLVKYRTYAVLDQEWRLVNGDELYHIAEDRAQEHNVIDQYPEVAGRLTQGYERIWQSISDEGAAEKYAYIQVGTAHENPSRINAHDMLTGKHGGIWHQYGAAGASPGSGRWKIEFVEDGEYQISLRRFPRESGLDINATFPAEPKRIEQQRFAPAGVKDDFTEAYLYVAGIQGSKKIQPGQAEVNFTGFVPAGKYDMEAQLIDAAGILHPSYYLYIEKL